jgi:NAD(P)H-dependent FMN reductase
MSLVHIRAKIECDECGEMFEVSLDPAAKPPPYGSVFEAVEDAVRLSDDGCGGPSISDDGKMLCAKCTGEAGEAAALISRYRVAQGLPPVSVDARLNKAAEVQARAVAEAGELSHGAFATRMASMGIGGYSAENLTAGSRSVAEAVARWKAKMAELDGYLFVTAEYNHSIPGVLKNALDHAYSEYHRKPAAFVGYGGVGGARAVEQLRLICVELQIAPTRTAVHIGREPYRAVAQEGKALAEFDYLNHAADAMLEELSWWTYTLQAGRVQSVAA